MESGRGLPRSELQSLQRDGVIILRMSMEKRSEGQCFILDMELPRRIRISDLIERTRNVKGLKKVEWEDSETGSSKSYLDMF